MKMTGAQSRTEQYLRFYKVYFEFALLSMPRDVHGASELMQLKLLLNKPCGRLLLKNDVWDAPERAAIVPCPDFQVDGTRGNPVVMHSSSNLGDMINNDESVCIEHSTDNTLDSERIETSITIRSTPKGGDDGGGGGGSGRSASTRDTGHFEILYKTIRSLASVPAEDNQTIIVEENTRKENHELLCTTMCELDEYITKLSKNTTNAVWPDIEANLEHKDKTPERQGNLAIQDKNDREEWTQILLKIRSTLKDTREDSANRLTEQRWLLKESVANELRQRAQSSVYSELQMNKEDEASLQYSKFVKLFFDLTSLMLRNGSCGSIEIAKVQGIIELDIGKLLLKYDVWYTEGVIRRTLAAAVLDLKVCPMQVQMKEDPASLVQIPDGGIRTSPRKLSIFASLLQTINKVVSSQTDEMVLSVSYEKMWIDIQELIDFIDFITLEQLPADVFELSAQDTVETTVDTFAEYRVNKSLVASKGTTAYYVPTDNIKAALAVIRAEFDDICRNPSNLRSIAGRLKHGTFGQHRMSRIWHR